MNNVFSSVKKALSAQADEILAAYGIRHQKEGKKLGGDWTAGFLCPLCGDKSGSASFSHTLHLICHQCGVSSHGRKGLDVFDWLARHTGKRPWDVCKELAQRLNVALPNRRPAARSTRSMPSRMTEAILRDAITDLWDEKEAEPARQLLAERKLDDQRALADLEVGWIRGWIVFPSRDERGQLLDRFRGWNPSGRVKWQWFGKGTGGPGLWPTAKPAEGITKVLLCEGEGDVLTARLRLGLHDWHVVTWTAGATSSPKAAELPRWIHGKEVHVAYDNDVFQGPDYPGYVVIAKPGKDPNHARAALEQRLRNVLCTLGPTLESVGCTVVMRKCPVDPAKNFGGDLRDWVDGGGRDLNDWEAYPLADLPSFTEPMREVPFLEAFTALGQKVRVTAQVEKIAKDDVMLVRVYEMQCEMGQHPSCAQCRGARLFPDGLIDMSDYQRELALGLDDGNLPNYLIQNVVQKPRGCPGIVLKEKLAQTGSQWRACAVDAEQDGSQRSLHVFSPEPPGLSGEIEIEGRVYGSSRGTDTILLASQVRVLGSEVEIEPHVHDFLSEAPCFSNDAARIEEYLNQRAMDFAYNVTKIHGRRDLHIAHDLLMHTALRANLWGIVRRGWGDICIIGDTRTGKSETFRQLLAFHGLGSYHNAVSNISRAGLLMGADQKMLLKPGLWPRSHGKALVMDETHNWLYQEENPLAWAQGPRDTGEADAVKVYGSRKLPAAARLALIANWTGKKRGSLHYDCEHFGALYRKDEVLSRMDFGLIVAGEPSGGLDEVEQFWTRDRTRSLIQRAWAQTPDQIIIDPEALQYARDVCDDWRESYDAESLPMFTAEEKPFSLMRIAISVANVCFSHPRGDPFSVHVRPVHVEWTARWFEYTFKLSSYDIYSQKQMEKQKVTKPFKAERLLTVELNLSDPLDAQVIYEQLMRPFSSSELPAMLGMEPVEANRWLSRIMAVRVMESQRDGRFLKFGLTKGGRSLMTNLLRCCDEMPVAEWLRRFRTLQAWHGAESPSGLAPMTDSWEVLDGDSDRKAVPF